MGMVLGKVSVEVPKHEIVHRSGHYEIWRYPSQIAATIHRRDVQQQQQQRDDVEEMSEQAGTSLMFRTLAKYIGVFSTPENTSTASPSGEDNATTAEKVAMTAPVVLTDAPNAERVAMTAPVVLTGTSTRSAEHEHVDENEDESGLTSGRETMTFLLPSKYTTLSSAPVPTNSAVKLRQLEGGRCDAVVSFSGNLCMERGKRLADDLLQRLKEDDVKIVGGWSVHGYNAPFVLPWLKRNEVHIPVDPTPYLAVGSEDAPDS